LDLWSKRKSANGHVPKTKFLKFFHILGATFEIIWIVVCSFTATTTGMLRLEVQVVTQNLEIPHAFLLQIYVHQTRMREAVRRNSALEVISERRKMQS
jgi:hypothetical protein